MTELKRRQFLTSSTWAGASLIGTAKAWAGANNRIRVALIGAGGRGRRLVEEILENEGVELAVVCDVDERRALEKAEQARKISGRRPRIEKDLRRIMDDGSIDAVTIATCNHWHALAGIWACQAGKHVYVEKPIAHNVWEGRKLVEAARKYDRIVQGGTNRRSSGSFRTVAKLVRDGVIGRVYWARCEFPQTERSAGLQAYGAASLLAGLEPLAGTGAGAGLPPEPGALQLALVLGLRQRGDGQQRDPHHRRLPLDHGPGGSGPGPLGGRPFRREGQAETPNTHRATFEFQDGSLLTCDLRKPLLGPRPRRAPARRLSRAQAAVDGRVHVGFVRHGRLHSHEAPDPEAGRRLRLPGLPATEQESRTQPADLEGWGHYQNFVHALRAGDRNVLTADIEVTHRSGIFCELANISHRVGREVRFDPATETIPGRRGGEASCCGASTGSRSRFRRRSDRRGDIPVPPFFYCLFHYRPSLLRKSGGRKTPAPTFP